MLDQEVPSDQKSLAIPPAEQEIVLQENDMDVLALILPPIEDFQKIAQIQRNAPPLTALESAEEYALSAQSTFREEFERQERKYESLGDHPTYLNRLANLAQAAGDRELEEKYLRLAATKAGDHFFSRKLGANLAFRGHDREAEAIFSELDLSTDVTANLRLAAMHVARQEWERAGELVRAALKINPLDYSSRLFDGGLRLYRGEVEEAIRSLRVASEVRPSSSVVYGNIGLAYLRLRRQDKAMAALRRAVALNPLNVRAVLLLADTANELNRDDEAIPSLRFLVQYDSKDSDIWSRIARACIRIGKNDEALIALHHLASLKDDSETWNNLGVAHIYRGDKERALKAFRHAVLKGVETRDRGYFLGARNMAQLLASVSKFEELAVITREIIKSDTEGLTLSDREISDITAFHLHALRMMEKWDDFKSNALRILDSGSAASELREWVLAVLIANLALKTAELEMATTLVDAHRDWIDAVSSERRPLDVVRRTMFINNVAFVLAEAGRISEAEKYLRLVAKEFHKNPFVTATMGLIDLRKGNVERGEARYEEAVALARTRAEKRTIRQKLFLELGRFWKLKDTAKSLRNFQRAAGLGGGSPVLANQAAVEMRELPRVAEP